MLSAMPSRRQSSAIECSPRSPDFTSRIFSSDEYCLRVLRRILRTYCSAMPFGGVCFIGLIFVPFAVTMSQKTLARKLLKLSYGR